MRICKNHHNHNGRRQKKQRNNIKTEEQIKNKNTHLIQTER